MKQKFKYLIILTFCCLFLTIDQSQSQKSNIKSESRDIVSSVGSNIKLNINASNWKAAEKTLETGFKSCEKLGNPDLCVAGIHFNAGFLYQQMSTRLKSNSTELRKKAIGSYNKVLKIYPDNQSALNNKIKLQELNGVNQTTIDNMKDLADKYPMQRVDYLCRIGNLYLEEEQLDNACTYFSSAYEEDSFSGKACGGIVELFIRHDYKCQDASNILQFSHDCNQIGFPNFSEELIRKQIVRSYQDGDFKSSLKHLVLWAYIRGENAWLNSDDIVNLKKELKAQNSEPDSKEISIALNELQQVFEMKNVVTGSNPDFWTKHAPSLSIGENWNNVNPVTAYARILYSLGKTAKFRNELNTAESLWQQALKLTRNRYKGFYAFVAADLANLYQTKMQILDPNGQKLNQLVVILMGQKGQSYSEGDIEMIHKYHVTLGGIFYDQKKWSGNGADNALFQLKRATTKRYGYKINPHLKHLLGDTYIEVGDKVSALDSYQESIMEYLSLDQINKAGNLFSELRKKYPKDISVKNSKSWSELENIIELRYDLSNKENSNLLAKENIYSILTKINIVEENAKTVLPKDYVEEQVFKGLTDLADLFPDSLLREKQIVFSSALEKIADKKELSSPTDYYRIKTIKTSFESSVQDAKQLRMAQINQKPNYRSNNSKSGFKTYQVVGTNQEIQVPTHLYELSGLMKNNYKNNGSLQTAEYKYTRGKFETVKKRG